MPYALMYSSSAAFPLDEPEVDALLGHSRERNAANGITGALLYLRLDYEHAAFLQVLEGTEQVVEDTFRRIEHDELHRDLTVLTRAEVPALRYRGWTMKFTEISRSDLDGVTGAGAPAADTGALLADRAAMEALLARFT